MPGLRHRPQPLFSPQADRERAFIRHEIAQGKTEDEIIDDLVAQYGTSVLAEPPKSGFDLTAWLVPGIAIIIAAIAIALRPAPLASSRPQAGGEGRDQRRRAARLRGARAPRLGPRALRPLRR